VGGGEGGRRRQAKHLPCGRPRAAGGLETTAADAK